jgi:hypothetical protein
MRELGQAPAELTARPLQRLGEGIGKVVYASDHWVVKRERSPLAMVSLIVIWRWLQRIEPYVPKSWWKRTTERPSRRIRFLRVLTQAALAVIPQSLWYKAPVRQLWRSYVSRDRRGEGLARRELIGTDLVPERVCFPPTRVRVDGWPRWLTVDEAAERVDCTLYERLDQLARSGEPGLVEYWLNRFLELRQRGWSLGLFSVDPHAKNFGIIGERIVLLDTGGLTNRWSDVERRLDLEDVVAQPHVQLGLAPVLGLYPDLAARFDARWRSIVNRVQIRRRWDAAEAGRMRMVGG